MNSIDILNLRQAVSRYIRGFYSPDQEHQKNIALKEEHTLRVAENMILIAGSVLQNRDRICMAEAVGLLHDIGRFSQYQKYRTFRDSVSINHGRLGAEAIDKENLLTMLPSSEQEVIKDAVRFHNALAIPGVLDPDKIFFLKMVRDADKLDIWRVFSEQFSVDASDRASAAGLGLPDLPGYSDALLACLREKRQATLSGLRTLTDFKIMQLTWVYDLNFPVSFRILSDRGHVDSIISMLPQDREIDEAVSGLRAYIRGKACC